ncbi:uncharacterized protein (DUF1501 family) [Neorhizobium galegae]|uniref:DUF1501 domain-containing protein n=1 Tax=Neorhizobium galegae TaxID=399 RepID=UPI003D7C1928|nr:uncharacterized protein (DUF1501 family) [Neorhizobium galegae]
MADTAFSKLSRRGFLLSAAGAATLPLMPQLSLAATAGDNRFVTIILRGAMDGLALVQPQNDPALKCLRPDLWLSAEDGLLDLDASFGLHPGAAELMPLWQARELCFVHAVATPYRGGRNHFEGQDVLETGSIEGRALRTGWLNRALSLVPRSSSRKALDITAAMELVLTGPSDADVFAPSSDFAMAPDELQFLQRLYGEDAGFETALAGAVTDGAASGSLYDDAQRRSGIVETARLAGSMLKADYRVASFSINGWDTHADQKTQFPKVAGDLAAALSSLKESMGEAWANTVVLAATEFGRSVRQNEQGGTEHGTASVAVLAGGALSRPAGPGTGTAADEDAGGLGGRVLGRWPGLADAALADGRDLAATGDLRDIAAALLHRQFDITPANLTTKVFPGLSFEGAAAYL